MLFSARRSRNSADIFVLEEGNPDFRMTHSLYSHAFSQILTQINASAPTWLEFTIS